MIPCNTRSSLLVPVHVFMLTTEAHRCLQFRCIQILRRNLEQPILGDGTTWLPNNCASSENNMYDYLGQSYGVFYHAKCLQKVALKEYLHIIKTFSITSITSSIFLPIASNYLLGSMFNRTHHSSSACSIAVPAFGLQVAS